MMPEIVEQRVEGSSVSLGRALLGAVCLPPARGKGEKEQGIRAAEEEATRKEKDPDTIWTDRSRLEDGGVGAGVAWYEGVAGEEGRVVSGGRDPRTAGQRKETTLYTYHGRHRSFERAKSGWRSRGFGIGGGHEAYDSELAALAYGLITYTAGERPGGPTRFLWTPRRLWEG